MYCIASLASISVLQLLTTAAGLPFAAGPAEAAAAGAEAAVVADAVAAVAGLAIGALEADAGAVAAGAGWFCAWDWELFPHAESTSVQAATSAGIFRFIIDLLGEMSDCRGAMLHGA
ncbi:MAG TPA: hypothetical protein VJQ86_11450 [Rhodanobacteraceae bacterium]|nr:hypothetical protein [Rhodanobacteraceae bacterium]